MTGKTQKLCSIDNYLYLMLTRFGNCPDRQPSEKRKEKARIYSKKPEVIKRRNYLKRIRAREYRKTTEYKQKAKAYRNRPEVKDRRRKYIQKPEVKLRYKQWVENNKDRIKIYNQRRNIKRRNDPTIIERERQRRLNLTKEQKKKYANTKKRWLQKPEVRKRQSMKRKEDVKILADGYVKLKISQKYNISQKVITKKMIEDEREIITINRMFRSLQYG